MGGGPRDFVYISIDDYMKVCKEAHISCNRAELVNKSRTKGKCTVCDQPIWKLGGAGLCFSCTTGEADASEDYELITEP